jgi:hypothetical protein
MPRPFQIVQNATKTLVTVVSNEMFEFIVFREAVKMDFSNPVFVNLRQQFRGQFRFRILRSSELSSPSPEWSGKCPGLAPEGSCNHVEARLDSGSLAKIRGQPWLVIGHILPGPVPWDCPLTARPLNQTNRRRGKASPDPDQLQTKLPTSRISPDLQPVK